MITQDQVIADIEAALDILPPPQDGDIPLATFAAHWRISQNGAKAPPGIASLPTPRAG
jgi:hypothetical protein